MVRMPADGSCCSLSDGVHYTCLTGSDPASQHGVLISRTCWKHLSATSTRAGTHTERTAISARARPRPWPRRQRFARHSVMCRHCKHTYRACTPSRRMGTMSQESTTTLKQKLCWPRGMVGRTNPLTSWLLIPLSDGACRRQSGCHHPRQLRGTSPFCPPSGSKHQQSSWLTHPVAHSRRGGCPSAPHLAAQSAAVHAENQAARATAVQRVAAEPQERVHRTSHPPLCASSSR